MIELTPEQFLSKTKNLRSKFDTKLFRAKQGIAILAQNHFKSSFYKGGFAGDSQDWEPRVRDYKHKPLIKSGSLVNSIFTTITNANNKIVVQTMNPYSQYHNDSNRLKHYDPPGNYKYNIKRQFMGNSKPLELEVQKRLQKVFDETFR